MTREEAIQRLKFLKGIYSVDTETALDMAIEALSADAVSREEYEEIKAYMDTLVDAFIEDGEELAESVKVVRCKDCRFYWGNLGEDDTDEMYGECRWDNDEMPNADDFCSYGERGEE